MKEMLKNILLLALFFICFVGCRDRTDPPSPVDIASHNAVEMITTLRLYLTNRADATDVRIFSFKDPDGSGTLPYTTLDTIKLAPNKTYDARVILLNDIKAPADSVSNEIYQESASHQLFYRVSGNALGKLLISYTTSDVDSNRVPVGLKPIFTTSSGTVLNTGKIKIMLMHQPLLKPASGQGDSTKGKVDIQVNFPVQIQ